MEVFRKITLRTSSQLFGAIQSLRSKSGAVMYPGGIRYFPRKPDEKDPEIVPTKLFRVERIKGLKHTTKLEKQIMKGFNIHHHGKRNVTVVKNIPENNARLWKIKHLIEINPITFPYGEPTANDLKHCILKENGECIVTKELPILSDALEAKEKYMQNPAKMTNQTIEKRCRLLWINAFEGGVQ